MQNRERIPWAFFRETCRFPLKYGDKIGLSYEIRFRAPVGEKLQGLEIGDGVIQPGPVQGTVEDHPAAVQRQRFPGGQHGIRIILLHGKDRSALRNIAQGVKIPQNARWVDPQRLPMGAARVSNSPAQKI